MGNEWLIACRCHDMNMSVVAVYTPSLHYFISFAWNLAVAVVVLYIAAVAASYVMY